MTNPDPKVVIMPMEDPTFEALSVHGATAQITNNALSEITYQMELYLGVSKAASSGIQAVVIPAGATVNVPFTMTMPAAIGSYLVYLDITSGEYLFHGQGAEPVVIEVTPSVTIGPIIWS